MGQLLKKTLILKDIKTNRQFCGIVKIHKNSIFKIYFDLKNINISENLTAAVISSNMPIQFIQFRANEFNISLAKETALEDIVIIIFSTKSGLAIASSDCENFLLMGYLDTIKNLRKSFEEKFSFNNNNKPIEPVEIVPNKEPLNKSMQTLKEILEQPKIYLDKNNNTDNVVIFKSTEDKLKEAKIELDLKPENQQSALNEIKNLFDNKVSIDNNYTEDSSYIKDSSSYIDNDILLREDSTLGDNLKIADDNYYDSEKVLNTEKNIKPFYETIKGELEKLFNEHEHEIILEKIISQSKFCKITYEDKKYYIVGIILEDNVPQFICYGIPTFNPNNPPKELKGFCSYIPTNSNNLQELGYWVMYQDAGTGETIYPET